MAAIELACVLPNQAVSDCRSMAITLIESLGAHSFDEFLSTSGFLTDAESTVASQSIRPFSSRRASREWCGGCFLERLSCAILKT